MRERHRQAAGQQRFVMILCILLMTAYLMGCIAAEPMVAADKPEDAAQDAAESWLKLVAKCQDIVYPSLRVKCVTTSFTLGFLDQGFHSQM